MCVHEIVQNQENAVKLLALNFHWGYLHSRIELIFHL